jgi:hypothetical protein
MQIEFKKPGRENMKMPRTIRLSDKEQEEIRTKCIEINKLLIKDGKEPYKDSELVHKMLDKIKNVKINKSGDIYIDE